MRIMRLKAGFTGMTLLALSACATIPNERAEVHLLFEKNGLRIINAWKQSKHEGYDFNKTKSPKFRWEFQDSWGQSIESHQIEDPRSTRVMFDYIGEDGQLHGGEFLDKTGLLSINIPLMKGEIILWENDQTEVDRIDFDPSKIKNLSVP